MNDSPNRLLAALPAEVFAAVSPGLKVTKLKLEDAIADVGSPIRSIYFPYSGVISLVVELLAGGIVETAMVGRDGVFDGSSGLGGNASLVKAVVHLEGVSGLIELERFRQITDEHESLRAITIRFGQKLCAETRQSVACNANHFVSRLGFAVGCCGSRTSLGPAISRSRKSFSLRCLAFAGRAFQLQPLRYKKQAWSAITAVKYT